MSEPENTIVLANAAGKAASLANQPRNSNPYLTDLSAAGLTYANAWNLGFDAQAYISQAPDLLITTEELYTAQRILTAAEVAALFVTPIDLLPDGVTDGLIQPRRFAFAKEAGTAWTLNASTRLAVQWKNSGTFTEAGGAATVGFLDQAAATPKPYNMGPSAAAGPLSSFNAALMASLFGKGLRITNDVAALTLGTGRTLVRVQYEIVPLGFWSF